MPTAVAAFIFGLSSRAFRVATVRLPGSVTTDSEDEAKPLFIVRNFT